MTFDGKMPPWMLWAFKKYKRYPKILRFDRYCGNTLTIIDLEKSVLFCKYLCNERSDLYETWNLSSKGIVMDNQNKFCQDLCTLGTHTGQKHIYVHEQRCMFVFMPCACLRAQRSS